MTNDDDAGLSWFWQQLTPDEQVTLLRHPNHALPGSLVERLMHRPGVSGWRWIDSEHPYQWMLAGDASRKLSAINAQLDNWWQNLSPEQRDYIAENRNGDLAGQYAHVIQDASRNPVNDPDAIVVVVARDANDGGSFRLPPIVRAFVEMMNA